MVHVKFILLLYSSVVMCFGLIINEAKISSHNLKTIGSTSSIGKSKIFENRKVLHLRGQCSYTEESISSSNPLNVTEKIRSKTMHCSKLNLTNDKPLLSSNTTPLNNLFMDLSTLSLDLAAYNISRKFNMLTPPMPEKSDLCTECNNNTSDIDFYPQKNQSRNGFHNEIMLTNLSTASKNKPGQFTGISKTYINVMREIIEYLQGEESERGKRHKNDSSEFEMSKNNVDVNFTTILAGAADFLKSFIEHLTHNNSSDFSNYERAFSLEDNKTAANNIFVLPGCNGKNNFYERNNCKQHESLLDNYEDKLFQKYYGDISKDLIHNESALFNRSQSDFSSESSVNAGNTEELNQNETTFKTHFQNVLSYDTSTHICEICRSNKFMNFSKIINPVSKEENNISKIVDQRLCELLSSLREYLNCQCVDNKINKGLYYSSNSNSHNEIADKSGTENDRSQTTWKTTAFERMTFKPSAEIGLENEILENTDYFSSSPKLQTPFQLLFKSSTAPEITLNYDNSNDFKSNKNIDFASTLFLPDRGKWIKPEGHKNTTHNKYFNVKCNCFHWPLIEKDSPELITSRYLQKINKPNSENIHTEKLSENEDENYIDEELATSEPNTMKKTNSIKVDPMANLICKPVAPAEMQVPAPAEQKMHPILLSIRRHKGNEYFTSNPEILLLSTKSNFKNLKPRKKPIRSKGIQNTVANFKKKQRHFNKLGSIEKYKFGPYEKFPYNFNKRTI